MTKYKTPILFPPRTSIHPGDDFYTHINGNWIQKAHIPPFISSYSVSEEIEDGIAEELQKEITKSMDMVKAGQPLSNEREIIGILAISCLQTSYQKNSVKLLKTLLTKLNCIRDINDVASTLGDYTRYRINTIISIFAGPETRNSNIIRINIGSGTIGLPDVSYYKAQAPGKMRTLLAYIKMLRILGKDFDIPNLELLSSFESSSVDYLIKAAGDNEVLMSGSAIYTIGFKKAFGDPTKITW
jgi:putative endopeptidase